MARELLRRWSSQSFGGTHARPRPSKPGSAGRTFTIDCCTLYFDDFQLIDVDKKYFIIRISLPIRKSTNVKSCKGQQR